MVDKESALTEELYSQTYPYTFNPTSNREYGYNRATEKQISYIEEEYNIYKRQTNFPFNGKLGYQYENPGFANIDNVVKNNLF